MRFSHSRKSEQADGESIIVQHVDHCRRSFLYVRSEHSPQYLGFVLLTSSIEEVELVSFDVELHVIVDYKSSWLSDALCGLESISVVFDQVTLPECVDRWGRSVPDLAVSLKELNELGVAFVSLTEALDLTTASGRAMAGLLSVFAEFEREVLRERILAGIAQARRKGIRLGRPRTVISKRIEARELFAGGLSKSEIARRLSISRASVRRLLEH